MAGGSLENFITGHVRALHELGGCPRVLLYDNLKAAVVERLADRVRFNAKLLELASRPIYRMSMTWLRS